jgi:hypothetical protein
MTRILSTYLGALQRVADAATGTALAVAVLALATGLGWLARPAALAAVVAAPAALLLGHIRERCAAGQLSTVDEQRRPAEVNR